MVMCAIMFKSLRITTGPLLLPFLFRPFLWKKVEIEKIKAMARRRVVQGINVCDHVQEAKCAIMFKNLRIWAAL